MLQVWGTPLTATLNRLDGSFVMQAVSLVSPIIWADDLQARASVRRLDLEASMETFFRDNVEWQAFSQLETLRLCAWSSYNLPINYIPLELADLHSLRHLHIENWSPKSIDIIACCRVYATWHSPKERDDPQQWLLSPCWKASDINLVSLRIDIKQKSYAERTWIRAIMIIMECHAGLELVKVTALSFGSKEVPFEIPTRCDEDRSSPLKVEINTRYGCLLALTAALPSSKALILDTKGPLYVGLPATREILKWYALEGKSASNIEEGLLSLEWQLAQALSSVEETQAGEVVVYASNTAVGEHAAHAHKRGAHALRCIRKLAYQCWGLGHTGA